MPKSKLDSPATLKKLKKWAKEGVTYTEMADRITKSGLTVSEAAVRRIFKQKKLPEPVAPQPNKDDLELAERLASGEHTDEDRAQVEVEALARDLRRAKNVIRQYQQQKTFEHRIEDTIRAAIAGREYIRPLQRYELKAGKKTRPHTFLAPLSDAHYGETVSPAEALGLEYNPTIAQNRITYIRDAWFRYAELYSTFAPVEKIVIPVLGDMLSGYIHDELEVTNAMPMVDQMTEMAHILFNIASDCWQMFPAVEMIFIPGNHPRPNKKPRHKQKFNNWEFAMAKMIQGMVDSSSLDSVEIYTPRDIIYVHEVYGRRIGFAHGDGVKSNSFAGIPFYGMRNQREAVQALMSLVGQERIDMFMIGHFHQHLYWQGECDIYINGAIKGGDEYSISTRMAATPPKQILLPFHPEHGATGQLNINLENVK